MTMRGKITNGVVVLQNGAALPEGTAVSVKPLRKAFVKSKAKPTTQRKLLRHAGKAAGQPKDAARNLDRYLYGDRKR